MEPKFFSSSINSITHRSKKEELQVEMLFIFDCMYGWGGEYQIKKNWQFNIEQLYTIMLKDKLNISEMLARTMNNNTHSNCICYKQNDFSM